MSNTNQCARFSAPEGGAVPAPLMATAVLLLLKTYGNLWKKIKGPDYDYNKQTNATQTTFILESVLCVDKIEILRNKAFPFLKPGICIYVGFLYYETKLN